MLPHMLAGASSQHNIKEAESSLSTVIMAMHGVKSGERGADLLPKLLRPGALKSAEQRRALRSQAGAQYCPA